MEPHSDATLIGRSLEDPPLFAAIFDRHAPTLLSYLTRRVGPNEAEDLLGELFLTAFEVRVRFDPSRSSALPWLYGIAANLVMKRYRTSRRHRRAMGRLERVRQDASSVPFEEQIVDDHARSGTLTEVRAALEDLSPADREVLVLYAWEGLSYADIADAMDLPVGTVRSRLNRVRSELRELRSASGEVPDKQSPPAQRGIFR